MNLKRHSAIAHYDALSREGDDPQLAVDPFGVHDRDHDCFRPVRSPNVWRSCARATVMERIEMRFRKGLSEKPATARRKFMEPRCMDILVSAAPVISIAEGRHDITRAGAIHHGGCKDAAILWIQLAFPR